MENITKVILAGNPNTGKTTLFNTITKSNEHAGNWHGVTVGVKEKNYKYQNQTFTLCDLPGLYSLDGYSKEEQIASDFIKENKEAVVVCIVDANNLKRNLFLASQLKERTSKLIIAVNMAKEVKLDYAKLEERLGVKIVPVDARKKKGVKYLLDVILGVKELKNDAKPALNSENFSLDAFHCKAKQYFDKIDKMLEECEYKPKGFYGFAKIDRFLFNPIISSIVFMLVMAVVFFITFGPFGSFLSDVFSMCFFKVKDVLMQVFEKAISNEGVLKFLEEGVFDGVLSVLSFMPQILLMFICLNFLEDLGYLSRVAVALDPLLKKIGLTGRSAFSLIMGFGCTTTAVITTRNLENKRLRNRTMLLLPNMSCSAKLPIYAVICSAFFQKQKALMVFLLYFNGVLTMLFVSAIFNKFSKQEEKQTFMLELPKYRLPSIKKVVLDALDNAKSFIVRVGGVLMLSSIIVFILFNFSLSFKYVGNGDGVSILESLAGVLKYIFVPLGFASSGAVIAILSGLIAKEMVVSSLAIVNGVSVALLSESLILESSAVHFSNASALSFLVFILLYSPCVSALVSIKKEAGIKSMILSFLLQFGLAYVLSFVVYGLASLFYSQKYIIFGCLLVLLAVVVFVVLKLKPRKRFQVCERRVCKMCEDKSCDRVSKQRRKV